MALPIIKADLTETAQHMSGAAKELLECFFGKSSPTYIIKKAEAEAKAAIILNDADIAIKEKQKQAAHRWIQEETRKQENVEAVVLKALPYLSESANTQNLDQDFKDSFTEKVRNISNEDAQIRWAKLLAGEVNNPGSFSRNTMKILDSMGPKEAQVFNNLGAFTCSQLPLGAIHSHDHIMPLVYDFQDAAYNALGINFSSLNELEAIGLIKFNTLSGFSLQNLGKNIHIFYGARLSFLEFPNPAPNTMDIGKVLFTKAGFEIFKACYEPKHDMFEYLSSKWKEQGILKGSF